jgi:ParB family chromosome partitioning protein
VRAADRLGAGTSFAQARDPRNRAKAQAQGDIPMYDLVTLRLSDVAPTPLNPRRRFGSEAELLVLGRSLADTQLQPCVAVPASAYLKLWPEHTEQIAKAGHVLINGERRWRAAQKADLETLDFTLRGDLAVIHDGDVQAARARLLDAVLKENIDRQNFDPVEEARGVAALVSLFGDGVRAGQKLGRGKAWVSQRLTLLALPENLQDQVSSGAISIVDGRWIGTRAKSDPTLTSEQLLLLLSEHQAEEQKKRAGFTAVNPAPSDSASAAAAVNDAAPVSSSTTQPSTDAHAAGGLAGFTAVNPADSPRAPTPSLAGPAPRPAVVNPRHSTEESAALGSAVEPDGPAGFTAVNPAPSPEPSWEDPNSIASEILRRFSPKDIASIARTLIDAYHESGRTEEATA